LRQFSQYSRENPRYSFAKYLGLLRYPSAEAQNGAAREEVKKRLLLHRIDAKTRSHAVTREQNRVAFSLSREAKSPLSIKEFARTGA